MISHRTKNLFYRLMAAPMKVNAFFYRTFRAPRAGIVKVHLGPGKQKYLNGYINVDANCFTAKCDVWADFRERLPFPNETVDLFYSHHVIEHLPDNILPLHFRSMYSSLKHGGIVRVGAPNGDVAIRKFIDQDTEWFCDWPDSRRSIGGRLVNFLLCQNEHMTIMTISYLSELAKDAGFRDIVKCRPSIETNYPDLIDKCLLETESEKPTADFPDTLIIECRKP